MELEVPSPPLPARPRPAHTRRLRDAVFFAGLEASDSGGGPAPLHNSPAEQARREAVAHRCPAEALDQHHLFIMMLSTFGPDGLGGGEQTLNPAPKKKQDLKDKMAHQQQCIASEIDKNYRNWTKVG